MSKLTHVWSFLRTSALSKLLLLGVLLTLAAWSGAEQNGSLPPVPTAPPASAPKLPASPGEAEPMGGPLCMMVCTANLERCQLACIDSGDSNCADNCEAVYELCKKGCH